MPTDGQPIADLTDEHRGQTITVYGPTGTTISGLLLDQFDAVFPPADGDGRKLLFFDGFYPVLVHESYRFVSYTL